MKYHILGISPGLTFPSLLCRITDPADADAETVREHTGGDLIMVGSFFGQLPDPATTGREALAFDTFEEAETYVQAEQAAGSTWIYALHCSQPTAA